MKKFIVSIILFIPALYIFKYLHNAIHDITTWIVLWALIGSLLIMVENFKKFKSSKWAMIITLLLAWLTFYLIKMNFNTMPHILLRQEEALMYLIIGVVVSLFVILPLLPIKREEVVDERLEKAIDRMFKINP